VSDPLRSYGDQFHVARHVVGERHDPHQGDEDQGHAVAEVLRRGLAQLLEGFTHWARDADAQSALRIGGRGDHPVPDLVERTVILQPGQNANVAERRPLLGRARVHVAVAVDGERDLIAIGRCPEDAPDHFFGAHLRGHLADHLPRLAQRHMEAVTEEERGLLLPLLHLLFFLRAQHAPGTNGRHRRTGRRGGGGRG
jgi:hypothetical protein